MKLRTFKKHIDYLVGEFIDDCYLFTVVNPKRDPNQVYEVIEEAIDLFNDLKDKANAKVASDKRAYFRALYKEMLEKLDALYNKLSEVVANSSSSK